MVGHSLSRRDVLKATAGAMLFPQIVRAEEFIDLGWDDLLPEEQRFSPSSLGGLFLHDESALSGKQPESSGIRSEWNGKTVQIPGFVVPLDFEGAAVSTFILVPYVGACVHVPPPPANQLVFVTTERPFESKGLHEPVHVTGKFGSASTWTQLAEIGYALSADRIEAIS